MRSTLFLVCFIAGLFVGDYATTTDGQGKIRFISPQGGIVILGPGNRPVTIPVQVFIPRHEDNRSFRLTCNGACAWAYGPIALDGEHAAAIHPIVPAKVQLDMPGDAELRVTVYDGTGRARGSAVHTIEVRGDALHADNH
jgi:hypothetical protein